MESGLRTRGRPATASRAEVLAAAREQYLTGHRVDVTVIARNLGVSRARVTHVLIRSTTPLRHDGIESRKT